MKTPDEGMGFGDEGIRLKLQRPDEHSFSNRHPCEGLGARLSVSDEVNHPEHYGGDTPYEVIKVIEAWGLGFHLGNAVKYIARAGKKEGQAAEKDLAKAQWYIDRHQKKLPVNPSVEKINELFWKTVASDRHFQRIGGSALKLTYCGLEDLNVNMMTLNPKMVSCPDCKALMEAANG